MSGGEELSTDPARPPADVVGVPIRDAATVILLRDSATGPPEVWMLTRTSQMTFAAGMSVFPGGRVDPGDASLPWAGRPPEVFAAELGSTVTEARAFVGAAVRELFEETGVLLSSPAGDLARFQPAVEAGELSFARLLTDHGLAIDADALRPWARWITPAGETSRRYDARFFVVALPSGAEPADLTSESTTASWTTAAAALSDHRERRRMLMTPTMTVLAALAAYASVAEIMAAAADQPLQPVRPRLVRNESGARLIELPDGTLMPDWRKR
jgi:8-oxo-dGTP pyrophosphatase MutT (NUDIX family)